MVIKGLSAHFDWFLFILEDRCIDDLMTDDNLLFHQIKTNRFYVAMGLFHNRSQRMAK